MSAGAQSDPRHDADVLLSTPQIYVARTDCDGDVIDAEECTSYVPPVERQETRASKSPARQRHHHTWNQQYRTPPPNIIDPQPWRKSPEDYSYFTNTGHEATDDIYGSGPRDPSMFEPDPLYPDSRNPNRKTHVMFGLFEDAFGLYIYISHTARRYLFLIIALIVLLSLGKLAEAVEFVIHFIF